jgi:hypothetical protein
VSEYQYYEFRTVDRRLGGAEQKQLRALSSRARITETRFVNHYDWGDFKGDPDRLMERHFDLFLYFADWGSRRLSVRVPKDVLAMPVAKRFVDGISGAGVRTKGDHLILDVCLDEIDDEAWDDDGSEWLDDLAPLRAALLEGDLRLLYLVWLIGVQSGEVPDSTVEPLPGLAPLSSALETFVEFFLIDPDLVAAASAMVSKAPEPLDAARIIAGPSEGEKTALLVRLHDGDPLVGAELRRRCRAMGGDAPVDGVPGRCAGDLRAAARQLAEERSRAEAARQEAERRRQEKKAAKAREIRLEALAKRGEAAWREVDGLIASRTLKAYEGAASLLVDLSELALRGDTDDEFHRRVAELRLRHKAKPRLIAKLAAAGLD